MYLNVHVPAFALKLDDCGTSTFAYPLPDVLPLAAPYNVGVEEELKISVLSGSESV